jgi:hypothetical protein
MVSSPQAQGVGTTHLGTQTVAKQQDKATESIRSKGIA